MRAPAALSALLMSAALTLAAQAPDRTRPPAPGPTPTFSLPPIQKRTLGNGLAVWMVEMHEVPLVDLTLIVKTGAEADPPGQFGLASFTAAMLDEGAGSRNALELADAIDFLGAELTTGSSFDASVVHLNSVTDKLDAALPLFADVVQRPTFAAADMERLRQERLTSLVQTRDNASALASAAFIRTLYGPDHRYGTPLLGTRAANAALTPGHLRTFHAAHYQPQNACLLVVGDVTPGSLLPKLEAAFGSWAARGVPPADRLPQTSPPTARHVYLVDKPGAAQSQIRIGTIGVSRLTPDYFVLDVLNTILGGSFTSRLNQNLREVHGYSYGASSGFDMRRAAGPFTAGAGVQTDKTAESLREFFKELDGIHQPVPAGELARARNLEALSFPAAFETAAGMAGQLADLWIYGLPDAFFDQYIPRVQAVTSADLQRAADVHLPTATFAVVVVGDLSVIEAPVRALNLGPVTVLRIDDVLN
jgi:predicted Zn-dependent peptidase